MIKLSLCGIVTESGRALVARRGPGGSQSGKWEFPGGKQEPGETPEQTLVREFAEELAVPVTVGRRVFIGHFVNGAHAFRLEAYETILRGREFRLSEHSELRWVTPEELSKLDLSDSDRQVAEAVFGTVARHV